MVRRLQTKIFNDDYENLEENINMFLENLNTADFVDIKCSESQTDFMVLILFLDDINL